MKKKRPTKLRRRLFRSYITATISITLVLFLVGLMSLLVQNAGRLSDYVREHVGFTLVLQDDVRDVEVLRLQKMLSATPYVKSTEYINKEDAAVTLANDLGEDFVDFLGFNPLFSSLDVKLYAPYMDTDSLVVLEKNFLQYPQVKEVYYQRDLVRVINNNVRRISLFLMIFALLLLFIFTALINNTIRISIYSQRFVINTMKLVGATRSFIRKPFLWKSIAYGLIGGLIANITILLLIYSYQKDFKEILDIRQLDTVGLTFIVVLVFGVLISGLSTYFAVNKFLRLKFDELYY
ncbi:cell division protein FtsX [Mangrovibacterium diazotrophicum]|uniref:Cell division protein FtsX n=1 Tax=Mangrovibacterium diazotrophicum TaxID=1261403 RepID=A0A419WAT2_9BACT|nr:permease-like cell division protein FtsX [Mangrovibacterium diazotrophicum]RKD92585.1 cell division transport system permease protein [Mangrovibacterium diazotrophicum]